MKTALITTTVNIPEVLKLYRACDPDVRFFVAIDKKTPAAAVNFCQHDVPNTEVCFVQDQNEWKCSDLIGWNTISRRNIALLEALKWGAEIIVTVDDDNVPIGHGYFGWMHTALLPVFNGVSVNGLSGWFDVGRMLRPPAPHRGFPHEYQTAMLYSVNPVVGAKVGVAAGICLGDPDISAIERISNYPIVHEVSQLLRSGIVVDPRTKTVFNSQNTAFIRELAPCFLMCPQFGRYDDIFASLIAQRVMRERNLHVHFGMPFVWQQRNPHDLVKDLKAELFGMEHVIEFAAFLDQVDLSHTEDIAVKVLSIYQLMETLEWVPPGVIALAEAWIDDVEKVL